MPEPLVVELERMDLVYESIPDDKPLLKALVKKGIMPITEKALADYKAKCEKRQLNFFERCLRRNLKLSHIMRVLIILAAIALVVCSPEMWLRGTAFVMFCGAVWLLGETLRGLKDEIVWCRRSPHNVASHYRQGDLRGIWKVVESSEDVLGSRELIGAGSSSQIESCHPGYTYPKNSYIFTVCHGCELYATIAWEYAPSL